MFVLPFHIKDNLAGMQAQFMAGIGVSVHPTGFSPLPSVIEGSTCALTICRASPPKLVVKELRFAAPRVYCTAFRATILREAYPRNHIRAVFFMIGDDQRPRFRSLTARCVAGRGAVTPYYHSWRARLPATTPGARGLPWLSSSKYRFRRCAHHSSMQSYSNSPTVTQWLS